MTVFADTSALYALLARETDEHLPISRTFVDLTALQPLATHSYVVVETIALLQRRLGLEPVRTFVSEILPAVSVSWIDRPTHERATAQLLESGDRGVSFVDHVSFAFMRAMGISTAFTLDGDFARQGFSVVPK